VPIALPMFERAATIKTLNARFFLISDSEFALNSILTSATVGSLFQSSTSPANHPAARKGERDVIHATENAVSMERGCPPAMVAPIALNTPFIINHHIKAMRKPSNEFFSIKMNMKITRNPIIAPIIFVKIPR